MTHRGRAEQRVKLTTVNKFERCSAHLTQLLRPCNVGLAAFSRDGIVLWETGVYQGIDTPIIQMEWWLIQCRNHFICQSMKPSLAQWQPSRSAQ